MSETNTNEIWKDIPDYEGFYQVSNYGRAKSLSRTRTRYDNYPFTIKGRVLKLHVSSTGYLMVNLSKNGKKKLICVHQLIAMAFLNHIPNKHEKIVDHIDNNKLNNRVDNLQIITNRENSSKDRNGGNSKYVGVCFHKNHNKYQAQIRINDKRIYLGTFEEEYDAHLAYQKALEMYNNGDLSFMQRKK